MDLGRPEIEIKPFDSAELIGRAYGVLGLLTPRAGPLANLQVLSMRLLPGCHTLPHHHTYEEAIIVTQGEPILITGDEELIVRTNSAILIPAGATHSLRNESDALVEAIIALTPPRSLASVTYVEPSI